MICRIARRRISQARTQNEAGSKLFNYENDEDMFLEIPAHFQRTTRPQTPQENMNIFPLVFPRLLKFRIFRMIIKIAISATGILLTLLI